jgi:uncharacterized protein (PEP-CTERM system associated)
LAASRSDAAPSAAGGTATAPVAPTFSGASRFSPFGGFVELPTGPARPWTITPSLGVQLLATDNVNNSARNRQSDVIASISPTLAVEAELARLTGRLFYQPTARYHLEQRGRDGIDHFFNGQALATLIEDVLFLDARGFGGLQSVGSGFSGDSGTLVTDRNNQVQTFGYQISPYLARRFGGLGTAQLGYSYQEARTEGRTGFLPNNTQPFLTDQRVVAHQVFATIRSGEDFGPLSLEQRTIATTYEGDSVLSGARRFLTVLQAGYALTRQVVVLGDVGYESQRYGGTRPFRIRGPVWSVGVRWTPSEASSVTVRYGRSNGFNSFLLDSGIDVGARTRLSATYSERIATPLQQGLDLLSSSSVSQSGELVSTTTNSPVIAPFGSPVLGAQDSLFRTRRAQATLTRTGDRDVVALSLFHDQRTPLTSSPGTLALEQSGYFAALSWSRALRPDLTGIATAQYGRSRTTNPASGGSSTGNFYAARLGLSQELGRNLFATAQYQYRISEGGTGTGDAVQNTLLVGLRQFF